MHDWDIKFLDWGGTECFILSCPKNYIVAFRGTEPTSWEDIKADLQFRKNKGIHRGFDAALDDVWEDLKKHYDKNAKGKVLLVTGHSLGAALTVISSYMICKDFPQIAHLVKNVTVGCPRVGNSTFKDNYNKLVPKSIRIVNDKDLVTRIPKIGFTHINEGITLNEKGEVITYSSLNPFRYFVEIFISDVSGEAAKDHFVDNYLKVIDKWDGVINN